MHKRNHQLLPSDPIRNVWPVQIVWTRVAWFGSVRLNEINSSMGSSLKLSATAMSAIIFCGASITIACETSERNSEPNEWMKREKTNVQPNPNRYEHIDKTLLCDHTWYYYLQRSVHRFVYVWVPFGWCMIHAWILVRVHKHRSEAQWVNSFRQFERIPNWCSIMMPLHGFSSNELNMKIVNEIEPHPNEMTVIRRNLVQELQMSLINSLRDYTLLCSLLLERKEQLWNE